MLVTMQAAPPWPIGEIQRSSKLTAAKNDLFR